MREIEIYTDGACSNNPGPGGWGVACVSKSGRVKTYNGFVAETTNNRMELTAAVEGLKLYTTPHSIKLYSDSAYLVNAFLQDWIGKWQRNNFKTSTNHPVENKDLWDQLIAFSKFHRIEWIKVKGHAENKYNNLCDWLARQAIETNLK